MTPVLYRTAVLPLVLIGLLAGGFAAGAADDQAVLIEPESNPDFPNGKVVELAAFADDKGPILSLEGLSIFQPVRITVISNDAAKQVNVKIAHPGGDDIIFNAPTSDKGTVIAKFRAQGDIRITVTSSTGRNRFNMIAWVGDTLAPKAQSILKPIP